MTSRVASAEGKPEYSTSQLKEEGEKLEENNVVEEPAQEIHLEQLESSSPRDTDREFFSNAHDSVGESDGDVNRETDDQSGFEISSLGEHAAAARKFNCPVMRIDTFVPESAGSQFSEESHLAELPKQVRVCSVRSSPMAENDECATSPNGQSAESGTREEIDCGGRSETEPEETEQETEAEETEPEETEREHTFGAPAESCEGDLTETPTEYTDIEQAPEGHGAEATTSDADSHLDTEETEDSEEEETDDEETPSKQDAHQLAPRLIDDEDTEHEESVDTSSNDSDSDNEEEDDDVAATSFRETTGVSNRSTDEEEHSEAYTSEEESSSDQESADESFSDGDHPTETEPEAGSTIDADAAAGVLRLPEADIEQQYKTEELEPIIVAKSAEPSLAPLTSVPPSEELASSPALRMTNYPITSPISATFNRILYTGSSNMPATSLPSGLTSIASHTADIKPLNTTSHTYLPAEPTVWHTGLKPSHNQPFSPRPAALQGRLFDNIDPSRVQNEQLSTAEQNFSYGVSAYPRREYRLSVESTSPRSMPNWGRSHTYTAQNATTPLTTTAAPLTTTASVRTYNLHAGSNHRSFNDYPVVGLRQTSVANPSVPLQPKMMPVLHRDSAVIVSSGHTFSPHTQMNLYDSNQMRLPLTRKPDTKSFFSSTLPMPASAPVSIARQRLGSGFSRASGFSRTSNRNGTTVIRQLSGPHSATFEGHGMDAPAKTHLSDLLVPSSSPLQRSVPMGHHPTQSAFPISVNQVTACSPKTPIIDCISQETATHVGNFYSWDPPMPFSVQNRGGPTADIAIATHGDKSCALNQEFMKSIPNSSASGFAPLVSLATSSPGQMMAAAPHDRSVNPMRPGWLTRMGPGGTTVTQSPPPSIARASGPAWVGTTSFVPPQQQDVEPTNKLLTSPPKPSSKEHRRKRQKKPSKRKGDSPAADKDSRIRRSTLQITERLESNLRTLGKWFSTSRNPKPDLASPGEDDEVATSVIQDEEDEFNLDSPLPSERIQTFRGRNRRCFCAC